MRRFPGLARCAAPLVVLLLATSATAFEIQTGATPVRLDVTSTSIAAWHLSNRNASSCDDYFGAGIERLNLNSSWEGWVAGLRVDGSLYYPKPEATDPLAELRCLNVELQQRYENTLTPEKVWLGWNGRSFEVTLGDSYVQFGRGLSLSLRKTDELGLDTTQRGVRVKVNTDHLTATLIGGLTNIGNIDEASGRYAFDPNDGVVGATADVRFLERFRLGASATGFFFNKPVSSISPPGVDETFQERWILGGPRIDAPRLTDWLGLYIEGVGQRRLAINGEEETGYGLYGSATGYFGPSTVLFEGKFYGDLAVVQPRFQYIEFQPVQYTALPTLERVIQPIEHPQRNIAGGRIRWDYTFNPKLSVFANQAVFRDWEGYQDPETADLMPGTIHDPYVGVDLTWGEQRLIAQGGVRFTLIRGQMVRRDGHLDLNVVKGFGGRNSLELHVVNFERSELLPFSDQSWREGNITLSYRSRPKFAVGAVLDYTTASGQPAVFYPGGTAEYDFTEASNIRLFAGSSRGGLRCISGVCRIFPPFTGLKSTLTLRY